MASLVILALSATSARAFTNYLANPGFESGTTAGWSMVPPWTWLSINNYSAVQNTTGFVYPSTTVHVAVHGGADAAKIWGYNQNTYTTTPGLQQTFAAAPGSQWTADVWANTQVPDNIRSNSVTVAPEMAYLQVLFLDAPANYATPLLTCWSAALSTNSPTSTWIHLQVTNSTGGTTLTAPDGTAVVRYQMIFLQPSGGGGGNPGGSCYWDDAELFNISRPDPEITVQPIPQTKVYGQTATFSVTADGSTTLSYKWQKDGADISDPNASGVTTSTLTLANVTTAVAGNYTVIVTDSAGPLTSSPALLTVLDPGVLSITPPLGQTKTNGGAATMSVSAVGSSALTYGWQLNGTPLSDGPRISGSANATLNISSLSAADAGTYTVLVDSGAATASTILKVVLPSQLATNELINPGFEDGVMSEPWELGWAKFNGAALATANDYYYLTATPVSVYDGTYVCRTYNGGGDNGLYENLLPATAGATYHAGGQFYVSSLDPVTTPAWAVLQVFFKDAGGNTIASFAAPHVDNLFAVDNWTAMQVTNGTDINLVAPAGTASATCQIYMFCQQGGGGSVWFDDLYLTQVATAPPPLPPSFSLTSSVAGGQCNISFPTTSGTIYEVLYTGTAASALSTWQTNTTVIGDGSVRTVPDTISAGARFYRVRAHNP